jgi:MFS family permease
MVAPPLTRSLWRDNDFVLLWTANTASQLGTRISAVAIPLLAVNVLAATPWDMGLLNAVQSAGIILVGLPAGAWMDRIRRRRLMLAMDLLRAGVLLAIPLAAMAGKLHLGLIFVVALVASMGTAFFDIAQQTLVPSLVGTGRVIEANTRIQASQSIAGAAGPGIGGVLAASLGAANTVLVTCVTFVLSFGTLNRIARPESTPEPSPDRHLAAEVAEGLRYVLGDNVLRAIALCTATANLFMAAVLSLMVVFLVRTVGLPSVAVGLIVTGSALGGGTAALTARRWTAALGQGRTIWLSMVVTQPFALLLPWARRDALLALFVLGWIVLGYGSTVYNIVQVSYRQASCPNRLLGRVQASNRFFAWGTLPLGGLLGGALGTWLGLRAALLIAAVGLIGATFWLTMSPLPRLARDGVPETRSAAARRVQRQSRY